MMVALVAASFLEYSVIRSFLDDRSGDGSADPYTPALHDRLTTILLTGGVLSGLMIFVAALLSVKVVSRIISSINFRLRSESTIRWMRVVCHQNIGWIVLMTLIAGILRWPYLNDPIRFDEAHTYLSYAKMPWFVGLSVYNDPNNHVFHTLLVHLSASLFGNAEWVIRLPAFVAGVLLVPLTFLAGRATAGREAGIAAGTLVAVSSALTEYSVLGRGYTMICCFTIINLLLATRLLRRQIGWEWGLLSLISAIGLWTIPIMVYPNILVWGWLLLSGLSGNRWQTQRVRFAMQWSLSVVMVGVLTLIFYAPVIAVSGMESLTTNGYVQALVWAEFGHHLRSGLMEWRHFLLRDWPLSTTILFTGFALRGCIAGNNNQDHWRQIFPKLLPLFGVAVLVVIQRVVPPPRVGLFFIPLLALLAGAGFRSFLQNINSSKKNLCWALWFALGVIVPVVLQTQNQSIRSSTDTGICPEAEEIVLDLMQQPWLETETGPAPLIAVSPVSAPLVYYAMRHHFSLKHFDFPTQENIESSVVIVSRQSRQTVKDVLKQLAMELPESGEFEEIETYETVSLYRFVRSHADHSFSP